MGAAIPKQEDPSDEEKMKILQNDPSLENLVQYIKDGRAEKIVLMTGKGNTRELELFYFSRAISTGAGISVSAGIPDFRTPGSGLYDNLQKYELERPEQIFDLGFFNDNPAPFYDLATGLFPSQFKPTPTHHFIKLLQDKGLLLRCFTQNIDTLEREAGVLGEKLVEAHGSFATAKCIKCGSEYDMDFMKEKLLNLTDEKRPSPDSKECIPWCACDKDKCDGFVKPDIVFFGENLPSRYFTLREKDLMEADLLIVAGTSLKVTPFADTMHYCNAKTPRLLINRERVGGISAYSDVG